MAPGDGSGAAPSLRPFWSGTITFGLVSVPVELYPAVRRQRVSLRMLSPDGVPLERRYVCPEHDREVDRDELVRGYEVEPGRHVVVTDDELERLQPEKSRDIDLRRFVPADDIDRRHFDRAYFLAPASESTKAYRLLADVMEKRALAGVATFVMRGVEYLVAILAEGGILVAETMRFADELRPAEEAVEEPPTAPKAAVTRMRRAVKALAEDDLDPDELEDPTPDRLRAVIERKHRAGEDEVEAPPEYASEPDEPVDLMAVLKARMSGGSGSDDAGRGGEGGGDRDDLASLSKAELYEQARAADLPGRSGMTKDELIAALR